MSGAERRRRKRQRELAIQAVRDLPRFLEAMNDDALRLHHHARVRAAHLQTRAGAPMPLSAGLQERAAGLDKDLAVVEMLLRTIFIERTVTPESIGVNGAEAASSRQAARRAWVAIRRLQDTSIAVEVADTAARAVAAAAAPTLHRLVWHHYDKDHRSNRGM